MFNWFKSKVELKKETDIMSSFHNKKGLKLGSEIIVPNNFECLIFYKGKCFNTLQSGKYKIDKKTFAELIEYQQKRNPKIKYIKCVCHYINISTQKFDIKFKKQQFEIEFIIDNPLKFTNLALLYTYKVDNEYMLNILNDVFRELLIYVKGDYKQINNTILNDYGIAINTFLPIGHKVSIFNNSYNKLQTNSNQEEKNLTTECKNISNTQNDIHKQATSTNTATQSTNDKQPSHTQNKQHTFPVCPKCNNVAKFNTTYCLRCGYKLQ